MPSNEVPVGLPSRVRFVHAPQLTLGAGAGLLILLGAISVWLVTFVLLLGLLDRVESSILPAGADVPAALSIVALVVALTGPALFAVWVDGVRRRRIMGRTRVRHDRLTRLAGRKGADQRLPHIGVELAYRRQDERAFQRPRGLTDELRQVLTQCGPGWTIVVRRGRTTFPPLPTPTDAGFEPLNVAEPSEQLDSLLRTSYAEPDLPGDLRFRTDGSWSRTAPATRRWRSLAARAGLVARWAAFAFMLYIMLHPRNTPGGGDYRIVVVGFLLLTLLAGLAAGRTWWLVPGGVVYRDHRLWRKGVRVGLITRRDSSVIIDLSGQAYFAWRDRLVAYAWGGQKPAQRAGASAALLAAWLSRARIPTREEVLAFMGPDAVWDETGEDPRSRA
jgi:hypothetical protein